MTTSSAETETKWIERVRGWEASGQSASEFARGKGFSDSGLRYWKSRLARAEASGPRMMALVPRSQVTDSSVVVEVGSARVRVSRGFDPEVLAAVVRALDGGRP
jgi:hypothetical protein